MTLPMASYWVGICQTGMPTEGERHGPSNPIVDVVVVAVEPLCPGVHPAWLGAFCPMGHGYGAMLGRTHDHPTADRARSGVPVAPPGAFCRVWGVGPRGRGTPTAPRARARAAGPLGTLSPRGA